METPWGKAQEREYQAAGITFYSTSSHGGFHLNPARQIELVAKFPKFQSYAGGPWYEEDQDWAVVAIAFPEYFGPEEIHDAVRTARMSVRPWREDQPLNAGWVQVVEWLDSDAGANVRKIVADFEKANADNWEVGSRGTSKHPGMWWVHFARVKDGAQRSLEMEYPTKKYYTQAEMDALVRKEPAPLPVESFNHDAEHLDDVANELLEAHKDSGLQKIEQAML